MNNNNRLTEEIIKSLKLVHKEKYKTQKAWTEAFKKDLYDLGKKHTFQVYPDEEKNYGEWLVDLCWSDEKENWQIDFKGLILACEIEWSKRIDDLIYDFQKLTVIDSKNRLFIFQFNSKGEYEKTIDSLKKACQFTKPKGYKYLIIASGNNEDEIKIDKI